MLKIHDLALAAASAWHNHDVLLILQYLVNSPEFSFATYTAREHPIYSYPEAVN
jgi:hypothetical protein